MFIKNGAAITWATQLQQSVAVSTTEAELKSLLEDSFNQKSVFLNIDSKSAICLTQNVDYHKRCKHIDVKYNFVKKSIFKR